MPIQVVPYDPEWPVEFARERDRLRLLLTTWLVQDVHHVGSTSVPGLASKPIIDMIAGVADLAAASAAIAPLAALGYVTEPHRPEALYFFRPAPSAAQEKHTHHLHLTTPGSALWNERLAFRDALLADPELAREYQRLKQDLARAHPNDLAAYTSGKRALIARVLGAAGISLRALTQPPPSSGPGTQNRD